MSSYTTTIVGVFSDYSSAEKASRAIIESGIPSESVHVQTNNRTAAAGRSTNDTPDQEGGISGFFHRLFGGEEEAGRYSKVVEGGRSVVVVDASDALGDRTVELLNQYGAIDIEDGEEYAGGRSGSWQTRPRDNSDIASTDMQARDLPASDRTSKDTTIPVIDEDMKVGKRAVQRGGVRVYSQVVDRPVEAQISLRNEQVRVQRRPVDRPVTDAELTGLRDQSFEMTETIEEPVIEKRARVKEEVVVGKETTERTQTIRDTVRRTDVKVERFEGGGTGEGSSDYDTDFRDHWKNNFAGEGTGQAAEYSAYAPAYNYGSQYASDPRYRGKSWSEVEPELRTNYERDNPGGTWDRMKNAIRFGWDKVTGNRR